MITLANLEKATKQDIFNQVGPNLLKQNRRSKYENSHISMYRGPNGLKCPGGFLISNEEYTLYMEGRRWTDLVDSGLVPKHEYVFIKELQEVHDNYPVREWKTKLEQIANKYNLDSSVLN